MKVSEASDRILAELLKARTGQQLTPSRRWRIGSALSGLYREHGLTGADELIALLTKSREASLPRRVVEALLNNETYFFRDRGAFDQLNQHVLPMLAEQRGADRRLSIWSVGCSTGQEALSVAMMLLEQEPRWAGWAIEIVGTDVSESIVEMARSGSYTQFQIQRGLSVTQMLRWFDETPGGWQAKEALRQKLRFEVHNLLDPPPSPKSSGQGRFDLILCRNVMLYFEGATRVRAFERLASALAPGGRLILGGGETVIGQTDRFTPDTALTGVYRLIEGHDRPLAAPPKPAG